MSEEQNVETNDGTWSSLKKTIIGTVSTAVLAGGTWITTTLFGGGHDKEETKTEQVAPAAPIINVNLENNNTNQQKQQSYKSNSAKAAPAPQQQQPAPVQAAPAQKESW